VQIYKQLFETYQQDKKDSIVEMSIKPIKLIILDYQMPRMNGFQVIEQLRQMIDHMSSQSNLKIEHPKFVIISAFMMPIFKKHLQMKDIQYIYDKPL